MYYRKKFKTDVMNDIHEKIILSRPLYLSGEHSAQQNEKRLKQLEDKFEKAEIDDNSLISEFITKKK
jgi:hypothetical protein